MNDIVNDDMLRAKLYIVFDLDCDYYDPYRNQGCGYDGYYCGYHKTMLDQAVGIVKQVDSIIHKPENEQVDDIFEDLMVGHNFDYAANAVKDLIIDSRIDEVNKMPYNKAGDTSQSAKDYATHRRERVAALKKEKRSW